MMHAVNRMLGPVQQAIRNTVARGVIASVNALAKMQMLQVQVLEGEVKELEHAETYGLTANPLPGSEAVLVFLGGDRSHGLVISTPDRRSRPTDLQPGEVAIYSHNGDRIVLRNGNRIEMTTQQFLVNASQQVEFTTPLFRVTGRSELQDGFTASGGSGGVAGVITGTLRATVDVIANDTSLDHHQHPHGAGAGMTDQPSP